MSKSQVLSEMKRFCAGEMLFWEGEPCAGIFQIAKGSVKIFKMAPFGREMMLALERAPSTVAELPLFDGAAYPASVRAEEPVVSYFINKADFQSVCREFPRCRAQSPGRGGPPPAPSGFDGGKHHVRQRDPKARADAAGCQPPRARRYGTWPASARKG